MDGDEVRHPGSTKRYGERSLERLEVDSGLCIERPRRAATQDDRVEVVGRRQVALDRRRRRPRLAKHLPIAGVLGKSHERELDGCHVDGARCRLAGGADRGRAAAQGDDGERKLLRPVGTDKPCDGRVGEPGQEPGPITARVGERDRVREHRAGVPVDVAVPALRVPPSRPPRDARHHDGGCFASRHGAHQAERVRDRVVPIDAIGKAANAACSHVQLEREQAARRPSGAEQEPPAVPAHGDAHDPGR